MLRWPRLGRDRGEEKRRAWEGRPGEGSNVQYSPSRSKPQLLHTKPVLSDTASTEDRQRLRQGQRETRTLELANWSFALVVCGACACALPAADAVCVYLEYGTLSCLSSRVCIYITVYCFSQIATSRHWKISASSNLNLIQKLYIYVYRSIY